MEKTVNEPLINDYMEFRELKKQYPGSSLIKGSWNEGPHSSVSRLLMRKLNNRESILDVGAGCREFEMILDSYDYGGDYRSVDTNAFEDHDYRDFLAVDGLYDAVLMFELLEHLELEEGIEFIRHSFDLLADNGLLAISTPNADHPNHVWRSDLTHVRPWPARDLWALLVQTGFSGQITFYRQYIPAVSENSLRGAVRHLMNPIQRITSRILDVDYAQGLLVLAIK